MKVYVAGTWGEREAAKAFAAQLADEFGMEQTHAWWDYEGQDENQESDDFKLDCALHDIAGVKEADVFILLNTQARGQETSGKAVEFGIAVQSRTDTGWPALILVVGEKTNIFHYLRGPVKVVADQGAALEVLRELQLGQSGDAPDEVGEPELAN